MSEVKFTITRKDLEVTWFSGSGGGGQHRNKHDNCCRIRHPETGVIVTGQSHKERPSNQKEAMQNLVRNFKFKAFLEAKLKELETNVTMEENARKIVDDLMKPENFMDVNSEKDWKLMTAGKTKEVINGVEIWT